VTVPHLLVQEREDGRQVQEILKLRKRKRKKGMAEDQ
jgi:hypothetical protein